MVKPDGVQRGLVGEIVKRFEQKGFKLVAMKFMQVGELAIPCEGVALYPGSSPQVTSDQAELIKIIL